MYEIFFTPHHIHFKLTLPIKGLLLKALNIQELLKTLYTKNFENRSNQKPIINGIKPIKNMMGLKLIKVQFPI